MGKAGKRDKKKNSDNENKTYFRARSPWSPPTQEESDATKKDAEGDADWQMTEAEEAEDPGLPLSGSSASEG